MTTRELITTAWNLNPVSILTLVLGLAATLYAARKGGRHAAPLLVGAFLVFAIAIASPLASLSAGYLFTAHMVQHLLLLLIVPLLVILAGPGENQSPPRPWHAAGWIAGVGAMWLWHEPNLCSLSAVSPAMQSLQTVTLLLSGYLFWRPIWGNARLRPGSAVLYLFSACLACTTLGIYISFVPISVCPAFAAASQSSPVIRLIRDGWGLSAAADQQVGGLLMWVPTCLIYLTSILAQFVRWHESPAPRGHHAHLS